jgi:hypothetical protein
VIFLDPAPARRTQPVHVQRKKNDGRDSVPSVRNLTFPPSPALALSLHNKQIPLDSDLIHSFNPCNDSLALECTSSFNSNLQYYKKLLDIALVGLTLCHLYLQPEKYYKKKDIGCF